MVGAALVAVRVNLDSLTHLPEIESSLFVNHGIAETQLENRCSRSWEYWCNLLELHRFIGRKKLKMGSLLEKSLFFAVY